jgi:ankyrin repeat protein
MNIPKLSILGCVLLLVISVPVAVSSQPELDSKVIEAVQQSDVPALAIWFANGGDINRTTKAGSTLLMMAAKIGDQQTIDFLFSQLPDVNLQNRAGATALMIAAKYGHVHVAELLLKHDADPLLKNNNGVIASQFARGYGHDDLYFVLQEAEVRLRSS